ncbi:hypothetical protein J6590_094252 [Homalodisca vitripennis]|nr:hypothetical protein J6590_086921 [Homalodisca vitripennis]KAG8319327.1 hypothetical protein J6590_094252 [Homalodisca vitripennis]
METKVVNISCNLSGRTAAKVTSGRRRRSNIGRITVNARRVRSTRNEKREVRRSRVRDRHTVQRGIESSVEREASLTQARDRYRAERENLQ